VARTLILVAIVAIVAMALTLQASAPVEARRPVAVGVASQYSTDLAALDAFAASVGYRPRGFRAVLVMRRRSASDSSTRPSSDVHATSPQLRAETPT
jgi:hypothetical protein